MTKPGYRIIAFQIFLLIGGLLVIEGVLRMKGYKPGDLAPNWLNFHPVDSIYDIHQFYTNSQGVLVADSNYWEAQKIHVNEEGFRSRDFNQIDTSKKKILFIGDSFTWGLSAKPLDSCFVDLIRGVTNYEVINLGIPATDPPQYALLASEYILRFKPEMVFVIFFMGNDLMQEDRMIRPGEPFYYYTNAGAVQADIDGRHFKSAADAYKYLVNEKYFLLHPNNCLEWIISKSALLSRLYSIRFRIKEKMEFERSIKDSHITKKYLKAIKDIARENHVPFKFVLIPEIKEADMSSEKSLKRYADILQDNDLRDDWLIPANTAGNFTPYPDAHLNNGGHKKYADFLLRFLSQNVK